MRTTLDWNVDGHYIAAPTRQAAVEECIALYGHAPYSVARWGGQAV